MATRIVTKSGSGAPTTDDLIAGELAVDLTNKRLYTEDSGGTVLELGTNPSGNVTFGDNGKAIFGAGSDLQIYHDGANSYVKDAGTGGLFIQGSTFVAIKDANGVSEIIATENGAVNLRYNGGGKLATTNTGIDVLGTVTADGLVVEASAATANITSTSGGATLNLTHPTATDGYSIRQGNADANDFRIFEGSKIKLNINTGGDISFYEDTGTTPKFVWSASAESLTLNGSGAGSLTLDRGASGNQIKFANAGTTLGYIGYAATTGFAISGADGGADVTVDTSGNVGIGVVPKTGGSTWQHVQFGGTGNLIARKADNLLDAMFSNNYYVNASNVDSYITTGAAARMFMNDNVISFDQAASGSTDAVITWSEAMRLDASGRLLIGQTVVSTGGSNGDDGLVYVNGGVVREGVIFDDFDNVWVQTNGAIIEGRSNFAPSNKPNTENWFFVTATSIDTGGSSVYCVQTATSLTGRIYTRYNNNITGQGGGSGAWSSWVEK